MKQKDEQKQDNSLFVGIDLGTSRSSISAGNNTREWIESLCRLAKGFYRAAGGRQACPFWC